MTPLLVTPGDPLGVGPELAVRVLLDRMVTGDCPHVTLLGEGKALRRAAEIYGLTLRTTDPLQPGEGVGLVDTTGADEPAEVAAIREATAMCLDGRAKGLVTGPIHKGRLRERGFRFTGHTDFLGHLCGNAQPVMAFAGGALRVSLATVHIPLAKVASALTVDGVAHTVRVSHEALRDQLGMEQPRIVVCGLNPHAGEGGVLGDEEGRIIEPAVARCRAAGMQVVGPVSAEAAFRQAMAGQYDLVVAMYHDQGLAPLKVVDFGRSVNWTLGLPILRTSVDHGTADDLAWTGRADPSSFAVALSFAERLLSPA